ncbi:MAG: sigma-54-dependent Fis family transcriptional regulator [Nitrospirae bacterium]|nr:sigma-54-dependent Fis family transcriptional regulator [Nitrospirota bacterium]
MVLKILVAEDEEITLEHLLYILGKEGYDVTGVSNGLDALEKIQSESFDVLIADIKMPKLSGMELLEKVSAKYGDLIDVIVITAYGSIESAVEAMKKGAGDYITKPFDLDELIMKIKKIEKHKSLLKENAALKASVEPDKNLRIIANSHSMGEILGLIESIKYSDCNVLLTGESGVGKSLFAKKIHFTGERRLMPFLSLNCATFTEDLLSSELFGHEPGAFTGAVKMKHGLVEIADTGTLFLDEIAEMSPSIQAKLLKFIEDGEFFRVGGVKPVRVDVRIIAATNKDIPSLLSSGGFRKDLYYRLNVMEIYIPPLRERPEDVGALSAYFLQKHRPRYGKKITGFAIDALEALVNYPYPGNVRELENIVERALILEQSSLITTESLPQKLAKSSAASCAASESASGAASDQVHVGKIGEIKTIDELNKQYVLKVLDVLGGNRSKAAEVLGISRTSLWKILKEE